MTKDELTDILEKRKFIFYGGKGGVGKTTMAATAATWLSDHGYSTLIVATDPTVSLSAIYQQHVGETEITKIGTERNLCGLNINPKKAMGVFQTRLEGTLAGFSSLFGSELLSTPCTEEIAAFDQFVSFFEDTEHDKVIFDTAPTGHTLRELSMPFDWSGYMANQMKNRRELSEALGFVYDESLMQDLDREKQRYDKSVKGLSDSRVSAFNLVLLPERLPIEETARAIEDLGKFGIQVPGCIVNEVIPKDVLEGNWFLQKRRSLQEKYLQEIYQRFKGQDRIIREVQLYDTDIHGLENLRRVGRDLYGA